jgi:hypothetical protein
MRIFMRSQNHVYLWVTNNPPPPCRGINSGGMGSPQIERRRQWVMSYPDFSQNKTKNEVNNLWHSTDSRQLESPASGR